MSEMAKCAGCGETKPLGDFSKRKTRMGRYAKCKDCLNADSKARWLKNGETYRKASARWRLDNALWLRANYQANREEILAKKKASYDPIKRQAVYRFIRAEALDRYGGCCSECGESRSEVLDIHHANGDGAEHRRKMRHSNLAWQLRKEGYPDGYEVLCATCHRLAHTQTTVRMFMRMTEPFAVKFLGIIRGVVAWDSGWMVST